MPKSKGSSSSASATASVRDAVDKFAARVRQNVDSHLEALAADLYAIANPDGSGKADVKRALAQIARATFSGDAATNRFEQFTRLLSAMRMLDEATSLRGILEGLGRGAAMEATRVAVMLVDGEMLRPFGDFGFAIGPRPADAEICSAPLLARAVGERVKVSLSGARSVDLPPFMRQSAGALGLAIPVVLGGEVVALLYAEGPERGSNGANAPVWTEHVEVLSRHAAARLEAVTSRRTVEVFNG